MLKGALITPDAIKNAFLGIKSEQLNTLTKLFEYHNEQGKYELQWSTLKHYYVTQRYLAKFLDRKYRKKDVLLREINYKFIADFKTFLRAHKSVDHQKPMQSNGVMKHLIRLRKMTILAIKLEWLSSDPFKNFKIRHEKVNKDFLTSYELKLVEAEKFDLERLEIVKDLLLFSCYTGLAYVDVANLKPENIIQGFDGEPWLKTSRQKNRTSVDAPLLPKAIEIIKKYCGHYRASILDTIFPVFSNRKVNSYLKEIADSCRINKNIAFHVARHTFATTVTLSNGVPIETVSKILGHMKIATT